MNRHVLSRTMSSREFNQNTGRAKQAADHGPLTITDRGKPAYVLMRYDAFEQLVPHGQARRPTSLLALAQPGGPDYDFEIELPPRGIEPIDDPFAGEAE